MATNKQYEFEGYDNRRKFYQIARIAGPLILAGLIARGLFTFEDVESFVDLADDLGGILTSAWLTWTANKAVHNVEPPVVDDGPDHAAVGG